MISVAAVALVIVVVQLFAPWPSVPMYTVIEGVDVGGLSADQATDKLNEAYAKMPIELYFGKNNKPYREPKAGEIGLKIHSQPQVDSATYVWWLRMIPTSLWWAHKVVGYEAPRYERNSEKLHEYVSRELGESCEVEAVNATLAYKDATLKVVPAIDGGTCELDEVEAVLAKIEPTRANTSVRIAVDEHPAKLRDNDAQAVADRIIAQTKDGAPLAVGNDVVTIPQADVLSWLDFEAPDSGVVAVVNPERAQKFLHEQVLPKVQIGPGTSQVTTLDFTEVSRRDGANGRTLDVGATAASLTAWLADVNQPLAAMTRVVPPTVSYTRTYSPTDTGLSALLAQFAQARPGSFGVSFAELDGKKRRAAYQDDKVFRTASTYKLFVAYGTLKRIESGTWRWTDPVHGGRSLTKCFDDMIVKSDNPCAEILLEKIGYRTLTNELRAIGLKKSSFLNSFPETTAGDLTIFVGALQSGQLLNAASTNTLLSAMKRNVYRQGIPAGASGQTADKVGFLEAFLHDAGVVYSPSGAYALSIMTEGSSWKVIADLTREIEKLRSQ